MQPSIFGALLIGVGVSIAFLEAPAQAQDFPTRSVRLVVPYPAGAASIALRACWPSA